jgi:cyclic-di-GMP-binding protein
MPSFDIVSEVNVQEVKNAIDQVDRERTQRYDFKGATTSIEWKDKESMIVLVASDDMRLKALQQLLKEKLAKRGVPLQLAEYKEPEKAGGDTLRQEVVIKQGLSGDELKRLTKQIKEKKMKVTAQIQGEQLRVSGKKRDDLQEVIALMRTLNADLALQFINFRD